MTKELTSIRGIDKSIAERLSLQNILSVADLQAGTATPEKRSALAKSIRVNEKSVYIWAKQTELMRIKGIQAVAAELLVKAGVRNLADLASADVAVLKKLVDVYFNNDNIAYNRSPSVSELSVWKKEAAALESKIVNNWDDIPLDLIREKGTAGTLPGEPVAFQPQKQLKKQEGPLFCGLSEMMVEIGRGVALAQHELNKSSIDIQNYIDTNENLSNYGLSATWYVLPETTFQLRVNYAVVKEEKSEGTSAVQKFIRVAPVNAKYQNYFKSSSTSESELRFKIVPVPPPVYFTQPVLVPDVTGMDLPAAIRRIGEARLQVGEIDGEAGIDGNEQNVVVKAQSWTAGTEVRVNEKINLTVGRK